MYPVKFSLKKSTFSLLIILLFGYTALRSNKFHIQEESLNINHKFVVASNQPSAAIHLNTIELVPIEANDSVIKHVVQRGDTLSRIATIYGTTVSKIREINDLQSDYLRVGQDVFITSVPGIIHTIREDTNFLVFANRYDLSLEDLMTLNYITQEETRIEAGTEVFLPITVEKAYDLGIEQKPEPKPEPKKIIAKTESLAPKPSNPVQVQTQPVPQPVQQPIAQPIHTPKPAVSPTQIEQSIITQQTAPAEEDGEDEKVAQDSGPYAGKIEAQRREDSSTVVRNKFAPGFCTYRAALKRPDIFPYTSPTTQDRPFGGNAKYRLEGAQAAGIPTGLTPSVNAIAVFSKGGRGYESYGHVGIVLKIDRERRLFLMSEMNGPGGTWVVSHRWVSMDGKKAPTGYVF